MDIKWWTIMHNIMMTVFVSGYNTQKVDTQCYCVTTALPFPDPKHENYGNYRGNHGNYQVIGNQAMGGMYCPSSVVVVPELHDHS